MKLKAATRITTGRLEHARAQGSGRIDRWSLQTLAAEFVHALGKTLVWSRAQQDKDQQPSRDAWNLPVPKARSPLAVETAKCSVPSRVQRRSVVSDSSSDAAY